MKIKYLSSMFPPFRAAPFSISYIQLSGVSLSIVTRNKQTKTITNHRDFFYQMNILTRNEIALVHQNFRAKSFFALNLQLDRGDIEAGPLDCLLLFIWEN